MNDNFSTNSWLIAQLEDRKVPLLAIVLIQEIEHYLEGFAAFDQWRIEHECE